ncbi:methionine adenosyltransferase [uncultured Roseobacter sp.]|uniref:methionine adenosyltransferase n=1 Tax=uncultured Roseobacter sp. TaxID=114847 RepID=UPI002620397B|nr:methionine adenosyltransferase [uncultured Roseobacter sp.]
MIKVFNNLKAPDFKQFEIVEVKGKGHPDSVVDAIADEISRRYSQYCLEHFGHICNHWVDKCVLIGGESEFEFGHSRMVNPMRLLVIGKATTHVGDHEIPMQRIARAAADAVLSDIVDIYDPQRDLVVDIMTNCYQGAGRKDAWYRPTGGDIPSQVNMIEANDAVICSGHAPFSLVEDITRDLGDHFYSEAFRADHPFIGTDIKVICQRVSDDIQVTACIPFKASLCPDRAFYDRELENIRTLIADRVQRRLNAQGGERGITFGIDLNTRDTDDVVYMSHYGSCLDTGDVGAVGRGNRTSGLITPARPMSIEAPAGKNPRYHSGKILDLAARWIATDVHDSLGLKCEVTISTQTGRPLNDPLCTIIQIDGAADVAAARACEELARGVLHNVRDITDDFVRGAVA